LTLDDIVVSGDVKKQLKIILDCARNNHDITRDWQFNAGGGGFVALFNGPPGTGKSQTAVILANELNRMLICVDLSRIQDKYVGETPKNLSRIFDEAERSQSIILFDEADALFARRTDVKTSNDRYANSEVNYLLTRLETFVGVAILTTNLEKSLDEAFARRILFQVQFECPGEKERQVLWRKLIPPNVSREEKIDFPSLAKDFKITGGHIKNAIHHACIQAVAQKKLLGTRLLWDAAEEELRRMGHMVRDRNHMD
jgi:SpoVK/Ycf46/Vps4 family AAA+-type ATPase